MSQAVHQYLGKSLCIFQATLQPLACWGPHPPTGDEADLYLNTLLIPQLQASCFFKRPMLAFFWYATSQKMPGVLKLRGITRFLAPAYFHQDQNPSAGRGCVGKEADLLEHSH
jgi:hypothetical protein